MKSVEHFYKYLYGKKFLLQNRPLGFAVATKIQESRRTGRIKWLQEYEFETQHRSVINHKNADAMSRRTRKYCARIEERSADI